MRSSESLKRSTASAVLISPWSVVPIIALALKGGPHLGRAELLASGLFVSVIFAVPITYLAVLLVGIPIYWLLLKHDVLNAWALVGIGATVAALGGLAFVGLEAVMLCGVCGGTVALCAWLVIRRAVAATRLESARGPTVA